MPLHNVIPCPQEWVCVKVGSRVEPQVDALLTVSGTISKHISLQNIWLICLIPQELEVELVVIQTSWRQLRGERQVM